MEAMESQETENMETEHAEAGNVEAEETKDSVKHQEESECTAQPETEEEEEAAQGEEKETEEPSEEGQGEEKKGFFKKKEKKNKQEEKIAELTDRVQRQMAEFDNFRKRTEKEKAQMFEVGAKSVIEKILPVVDNFERGLSAVPEESKEDPFVQGMDKIYKQLMTELENLEVKPIEAVGAEFNPDFHNAVMQVESEEYESGFVAQELQRGYMYRDSVVRHSMVAVVQ
ncbi:MAG: nucleotide exchange factor GrpE [Lachnospiraceae bacterium]|nr:nucleotide exchange factor GrpE [Lachnospiraceae bacterium]